MTNVPLRCMVVDDDDVSRSIIIHHIKKNENLELTHVCESAIDAHNILLKDKELNILFLDIEMPEMNGLELVQMLGNQPVKIILTTSCQDYAVEAFEHSVSDYLVKPISYPRFLKAVNKLSNLLSQEKNNTENNADTAGNNAEFLFVRSNHKIVKIQPKDIAYIEALSDYIVIHTEKESHTVHSTMKGINSKLEAFRNFVRVHRSYIINVEHIDSVQDVQVTLNGNPIPIGRSYRADFMDKLDIL